MKPQLYGISNCDTVKKARRWLDSHGVDYSFHDFRQDGLSEDRLADWCDQVGWETLLNRRSTTWRQLPEAERTELDGERAQGLMLAQPTLIKRPVLDAGDQVVVGFAADDYAKRFD